jgi:serine/threonine protein kinase
MLTKLLTVFLTRRYTLRCERRDRRSPPSKIKGGISPPYGIEGVDTSPLCANVAAPDDFDRDYLKNLIGLPTIFSFQALQTATGSFSKEIGRGGFGKVYEGALMDGTQVAVKCLLDQTGHGQQEFCAEIATISSLNHSNLVRLCGICVEGRHRILVYELMPNGSLDRWLFSSDNQLDWKTRYSIALDTARGLAYLHEESRLGILHLDVKPQNILLDEDFKAKVSDFGMARSLNRDSESRVMTGMRGTPGYMAPEWLLESGITYKTDVFSYGMVLLEIVRGSKNMDRSQDSENRYFPSVAFRKARQGKMDELIQSGLQLKRPQEMDEAHRLIKTALWCIQNNSALRPSMGTVVRFLEGDLEAMDPPFTCILPFALPMDD